MEFEWDNHKNELNKEKHGVSFEEAKSVFDDVSNYKEKTNRIDELRYKGVYDNFPFLFAYQFLKPNLYK